MKWKERKRKHDDAHNPMGGKGKRATKPKGDRKLSKAFIEKFYIDPLKTELLIKHGHATKGNSAGAE